MGLKEWLLRLIGVDPDALERQRAAAEARVRARQQQAGAGAPTKAPARPKLNLDPGQFAPISDAELKRQASKLSSAWSQPFWGRRDLIPPADDARTQLIDRGMVTHGFLTSEQLVEIHKIGAEMDAVRPDLALAHHEAERIVARSREEKQAEKERKKQEAAVRREKRAREVAERRATDIAYLGPGVSAGLADRRANVEVLTKRGLPVLATPADVAAALGLTVPRLRWLAYHAVAANRSHYVSWTTPKKSGGTRKLSTPHRQLKAAQGWLLRQVLDPLPAHPAAHGFVRGRSTVTNAAPHVGRAVVVNLDLKDFFPTITFPRVRGALTKLGYSPAAATVLALLATESPRQQVTYGGRTLHVATGPRALPQGAPTSPALSNLVARRLDARLTGLAKKLGFTYTRYADDLTFSGGKDQEPLTGYLLAKVRHIAQGEGFAVNETKTRVQRQNARQQVTGIVVNQRPGVPRKEVRRLRAILHRAKTEGLLAQNRENREFFVPWLKGMIAYVRMVNPVQAAPLEQALEELQAKG